MSVNILLLQWMTSGSNHKFFNHVNNGTSDAGSMEGPITDFFLAQRVDALMCMEQNKACMITELLISR